MDAGIYIAIFYITKGRTIRIGRLGQFRFRRGIYFYIGSAQRNLSARLERHSRKTKSLHWHIDYLSVRAVMLGAIIIDESQQFECKLAKDMGEMFELAVPGFGASDCRCDGHLFYTKELP